ncbi:hypothetical protein WANG_p1155 (plasmid) [Lactobacillus kefiranofaciens subsp. kefiranofaciens]|nr:hypothetical protein WANG_p1155 [Lactobacillus kefiranofaciens subsp. kefiranofaciens]
MSSLRVVKRIRNQLTKQDAGALNAKISQQNNVKTEKLSVPSGKII